MEKSIDKKKHISFSNAPPMVKQKSWDDTDFLQANTWTKSHISKRKKKEKRNEGKSTRKERHNLNKTDRLNKLREANIAHLSQNMRNKQNDLLKEKQDLAKEELLREEKKKDDLIKEQQYKQELLLKHQQIQKLLEEKQKQKQIQTHEIPVNNEDILPVTELNNEHVTEPVNLKNKGKWHKVKKTIKGLFGRGGKRKSRTRKLRTKRRK